jgi:cytochrome c oxidase cbb3-type subunit 3
MSGNETGGPPGRDIDHISGVETTGHEWDGIKELNNPLPRWWLWTFYGCIVWAIGYTVFFPAWPLVSSATSGVLGYSSRGELAREMATVDEGKAGTVSRISAAPVESILADPELARFATSAGASAFKVNCTQCHGTGAAGGPGYPNLNDDAWIWGGTIAEVYQTIAHGVRSPTDTDTRYNMMPNFGVDGMLDHEQVKSVATYVAGLSGLVGGAITPEGEQLFVDNCSACHAEGGVGMPEVGGPALNDRIWLYEGSLAAIEAQVNKPRHGVMQSWSEKLDDVTIKELAIYVHGLGGGL